MPGKEENFKKKLKHEHAGPQKLPLGGLGHLEVPWEYLLASKLKIYVETICCEHFVFYWKKMFVSQFSDFVYWKLPIFWRFWWKPFFALIIKGYKQKLSKNLSHIGFRTYFINIFLSSYTPWHPFVLKSKSKIFWGKHNFLYYVPEGRVLISIKFLVLKNAKRKNIY